MNEITCPHCGTTLSVRPRPVVKERKLKPGDQLTTGYVDFLVTTDGVYAVESGIKVATKKVETLSEINEISDSNLILK